MNKRAVVVTLMLALVFCLTQVTASFAEEKVAPAKAEAKTPAAKGLAAKATPANVVAVCGCGMVFVPDATTKFVEHAGKAYACCTEGCHKMAEKNPEAAAQMAEENLAKLMKPAKPAAAEHGK